MDIMEVLTLAKNMGFDVGQIISLAVMYVALRKDLLKVLDQQLGKLIDAIKDLEKAHNARLDKIEAHVGLKKEE